MHIEHAGALARYEEAQAYARDMLLAAKEGEWDKLVGLAQKYTACVDELKAVDVNDTCDPGFPERKAELIHAILAMDAETKNLVRDWMLELGAVLNSINADRKLKKAYEGSE